MCSRFRHQLVARWLGLAPCTAIIALHSRSQHGSSSQACHANSLSQHGLQSCVVMRTGMPCPEPAARALSASSRLCVMPELRAATQHSSSCWSLSCWKRSPVAYAAVHSAQPQEQARADELPSHGPPQLVHVSLSCGTQGGPCAACHCARSNCCRGGSPVVPAPVHPSRSCMCDTELL